MISFTVSFIRWKVVSAPAAAELIANAKSISSSVAVSAMKEKFDKLVTKQILQLSRGHVPKGKYCDALVVFYSRNNVPWEITERKSE